MAGPPYGPGGKAPGEGHGASDRYELAPRGIHSVRQGRWRRPAPEVHRTHLLAGPWSRAVMQPALGPGVSTRPLFKICDMPGGAFPPPRLVFSGP